MKRSFIAGVLVGGVMMAAATVVGGCLNGQLLPQAEQGILAGEDALCDAASTAALPALASVDISACAGSEQLLKMGLDKVTAQSPALVAAHAARPAVPAARRARSRRKPVIAHDAAGKPFVCGSAPAPLADALTAVLTASKGAPAATVAPAPSSTDGGAPAASSATPAPAAPSTSKDGGA